MRRNWIKVYVDQCLRGTMMDEMEDPAERFVWFGFLLLAGDSPFEGKIALTENMGYTDEQLGSMLKCNTDIIKSAKEKMIKHDKILVLENNIIEIVKWKKYQSEYGRIKKYTTKDTGKSTGKSTAKTTNPSLSLSPSISPSYSLSLKDEILIKWNSFAGRHDIPIIKLIKPGSTRERHLKARVNEDGFNIDEVLIKVEQQPFLLGKKGWAITFDWLILPSNYQKVIEGNYLERNQKFSGIKQWLREMEEEDGQE